MKRGYGAIEEPSAKRSREVFQLGDQETLFDIAAYQRHAMAPVSTKEPQDAMHVDAATNVDSATQSPPLLTPSSSSYNMQMPATPEMNYGSDMSSELDYFSASGIAGPECYAGHDSALHEEPIVYHPGKNGLGYSKAAQKPPVYGEAPGVMLGGHLI